jgi:agmatine deiminase
MNHTSFSARQSGYRLPAEWEPQAAVWFSWPVAEHIWPGRRAAIWAKFAEIAAAAARFEEVRINADPVAHAAIRAALDAAGADPRRTILFPHPTDDVWCRDHGPLFLQHRASGHLLLTDWQFNAWGGKFAPYARDNAVPARIAASLGLERVAFPHVLEGGAIEVNGAGCLLTTASVLLNHNREPQGADPAAIADRLRAGLGVDEVFWLEDGLPGDDTDGHIDNITRFFAADGVLAVRDPRVPVLERNFAALRARFADVRPLPLPASDGPPFSYANFLILNDAVLAPVFAQPAADAAALAAIGACFPGRAIVPVDCRLLLAEGGAIHCLSMQQPAAATAAPPCA